MELSDILILIVLGIFAFKGLINGLILEVLSLLGLALGFLVSYKYYYYIASLLKGFGVSEDYSIYISYVLTFLAVYIAVLIVAKILSKFLKLIRLGWINRTGGFVFGILKGGVLIGVLLTLVFAHISDDNSFKENIKKAPVTKYLLEVTPKLFDYFNDITKGNKENPFKKVI